MEDIAQAHIAAIECRLENVRRRHETLSRLHHHLSDRREEVIAAFAHDFGTSIDLTIGLEAILRSIVLHAGELDQVLDVKIKHAVEHLSANSVHVKTAPVGLVSILATDGELQYPLDTLLSPLIAATAAGNSCILVMARNKSQVFTLLRSLIKTAFQGSAASVVVEVSDGILDYLKRHANLHVTFGNKTTLPNSMHIPAKLDNVVIVDASVVHADFYRTKKKSRKDKNKLHNIAKSIREAQKYGTQAVYISENIFEPFKEIYTALGGHAQHLQSTTSIEHAIALIGKLDVGHLSCFATKDFVSFYATNVLAKSVSIDSIPVDFLVGYCPVASALRPVTDATTFSFGPLWPTTIFVRTLPVVNVPQKKLDYSTQSTNSATIPTMKRKHVSHLEFFPTGFVITFFPIFATLVGVTSFVTYKLALTAYRSLAF